MRNKVLFDWWLSGASEPETSFSFQSVQPGTLNQVAIIFKTDPGDYTITIDYGDGVGARAITADGHDHTITISTPQK